MHIISIISLSFAYFLCGTSTANAYLDPGTGSIILQGILAFIASTAATIIVFWANIKKFIKKFFEAAYKIINSK